MEDYFRPKLLEEALTIRAARPVTVLAGGTDVYPAKTARAGWGDMRRDDILDVSAIDSLRGITHSPDSIRLPALTTWSDLRNASLPQAFGGLQEASREIGGRQIQNRGTLVGNICTASPAGDGIPCLLTLDAEVEIASLAGRRTVALSAFIDGYRHTLLGGDEIVTAIAIPMPKPSARGKFLKLGARRYLVISIVMAAGVVSVGDDGRIEEARIAVGACTPVAQRLLSLEAALLGASQAEAADIVSGEHFSHLAPIDDIRGSGAFRHAAATSLVRDLLAAFAVEPHRRAA